MFLPLLTLGHDCSIPEHGLERGLDGPSQSVPLKTSALTEQESEADLYNGHVHRVENVC